MQHKHVRQHISDLYAPLCIRLDDLEIGVAMFCEQFCDVEPNDACADDHDLVVLVWRVAKQLSNLFY